MAAFRYDRTRHSSLVSHLTSESGRQNHVHSQSDPAGLQAALRTYFQTFPDFHLEVEDRISSGDKIVARLTLTAAHNSPVQLAPNTPVFPPTGRKLKWIGIDIWRVADGKFVEHWDQTDFAGLAR